MHAQKLRLQNMTRFKKTTTKARYWIGNELDNNEQNKLHPVWITKAGVFHYILYRRFYLGAGFLFRAGFKFRFLDFKL